MRKDLGIFRFSSRESFALFDLLGNLPGSTRILSAQAQHAEAMKNHFDEEQKQMYGEYFDLFQHHLQTNFAAPNLNRVNQV